MSLVRLVSRSSHAAVAIVLAVGLSQFGAKVQAGAADPDVRLGALSSDANAAKISTRLLRLEKKQAAVGSRVFGEPETKALRLGKKGIMVEAILTRSDAATLKKLNVPGAEVRVAHPEFNRANLEVSDLSALHALAALPEVAMLRTVYRPHTRTNNGDHSGLVNSRDRRALNAAAIVTTDGLNGSGQTVGILSDSFAVTDGVRNEATQPAPGEAGVLTGATNQNSGDLPATVNLLADDPEGFDEGAGMGELVHDIAPGAAIAFHAAGATEADFAVGIDRLRMEAGATVLVDDVGFLDEPFYQTGLGADAEQRAISNGIPYFSAAGNDENRCLRQPYVDIAGPQDDQLGRKPIQFTHLHDWGGGNPFLAVTVGPDDYAYAILQWNQPFQSLNRKAGSQVDFDLYVLDTPDISQLPLATNVSVEIQGKTKKGKGDAWEGVEIDNTDLVSSRTFYIVVDHIQGNFAKIPQDNATPLEITMMFPFSGNMEIAGIPDDTSAFGGPTAFGHVQAKGVISVGAIPWWESPLYNPLFPPTAGIDPEYYTSRGGNQTVFFNRAGVLAPVTSFSPIITGVDGESTTFFYADDSDLPDFLTGFAGEPDGFPDFFGTSAAAPSAAGVAALLRQQNSQLHPGGIADILKQTAVDITGDRAGAGTDDVSGAGLIDANAALQQLPLIPDLRPSHILGWSDSFFLSNSTGATADSPLSRKQTIYANFAVENISFHPAGPSVATVSVDGVEVLRQNVVFTSVSQPVAFSDLAITIPKLKKGQHTFTLTIDADDDVAEIQEDNNVQTKVVTVK